MISGPHIGPYALDRCIGRGGMGEVWSAEHVHAGRAVAIKVMTDERVTEVRYQRAFRHEIRAVAGLDHPRIVRVHDVGVVPAEAAAQLAAFRTDAPYLVMDLLPEGSLRDTDAPLRWPRLRQVLLDVLAAFAHAHARGVLHRDVKPDNLLWTSQRTRVVLTDFGVAHATDRDGADLTGSAPGEAVGTPAYMAPEQIKGLWREQGPWTDLYALGCTAWELICGRPPHCAPQPLATMVAQLTQPLPVLRPQVAVPAGLIQWVRRMLAKHPRQRFARAADAAFALEQLGSPAEVTLHPTGEPQTPLESQATLAPLDVASAITLVQAMTLDDPPALPTDLTPLAELVDVGDGPPPLPPTWRACEPERPDSTPAAGLGLFDLRPIPFVGREAERDTLWRALRAMLQTRQPAAALILGPSGYGKTRLATWLTEQAHATGAATPLHVFYGAEPGPAHGHGAMLRRFVHAHRLSRADLVPRIQAALGHLGYDDLVLAQSLAELIEPADDDERTRQRIPRLETAVEAFAVARRFVRALAEERPVVLHIDDAQWGAEGLEFARQLLDTHPDLGLPLLVVVTARTDLLSERPIEEANLTRLAGHPNAHQIRVGPLPEVARHALLQRMLGLSQGLARRIDARTGGNPLYAVQLVRAWNEHHLLLPSPEGIDLRPAADPDAVLPSDLHDLWGRRVEALLADRPAWQAEALELAAVLGLEVHSEEWRRALARGDLDVPVALVDALLDQGLARTDRGGPEASWAFAHAMLREAILAQAAAHGRLEWHHDACAAALRALPKPPAGRIARHLLGAGHLEAALEPLAEATDDAIDQGNLGAAKALLDQRTDLLTRLGTPASDARWGEGWVHAAHLALLSGDFDRAAAFARRTDKAVESYDWLSVRARLEYVLGSALRDRGRAEEARERIQRGLGLAEQAGDTRLLTRCRAVLAQILLRLGEVPEARAMFERTRDAFLAQQDPASAGLCELALARISQREGRLAEAEALNTQAHDFFDRATHRDGLARCANQRGDLLRRRGALDEAAAAYREALARWQVIDAPAAVFAQANLALTLVDAGRADEALPTLTTARDTFRRLRQWPMVAAVTAAALPCHAALGDWVGFKRDLLDATHLIHRTGLIDVDSSEMLELAGLQAQAGDRPDLAIGALRLARRQWVSLGRADRVRGVDQVIARLPA